MQCYLYPVCHVYCYKNLHRISELFPRLWYCIPLVTAIYNNATFADSLRFLCVQKVFTQWYQFSYTALWPLSEQDNLYMKTQSQLCGVSSLVFYDHIFCTHHQLLVNLISLQLLLMLCSYGHYSSGGIEWYVPVAWRRRRMHRKFHSWYECIPE